MLARNIGGVQSSESCRVNGVEVVRDARDIDREEKGYRDEALGAGTGSCWETRGLRVLVEKMEGLGLAGDTSSGETRRADILMGEFGGESWRTPALVHRDFESPLVAPAAALTQLYPCHRACINQLVIQSAFHARTPHVGPLPFGLRRQPIQATASSRKLGRDAIDPQLRR